MVTDYDVLNRLDGLRLSDENHATALCPAHDDKNPSLSIKDGGDRLLVNCHAGCSFEQVRDALGAETRDFFADGDGEGVIRVGASIPPESRAHVHTPPESRMDKGNGVCTPPVHMHDTRSDGCTLERYAEAKRLPVEELEGFGLKQVAYWEKPALRIPYADENGKESAVRFRTALDGPDKFRWKKGTKPTLYGLHVLADAHKQELVVVVEGESDCHTLWHHDVPAVGVPGASNWRDEWAAYFAGTRTVFAVVEPDGGGETLWRALAESPLRDRLHRVELDGVKDVSELHLQDPERFRRRFDDALNRAVLPEDLEEFEAEERRRETWAACEKLATSDDILARFAAELTRSGLAGETRTARIVYLAATSRLLDKPVSVAVKGPSSGGKSFTVEQTLRFFPESAYHARTGMSEHALAYSEAPLAHRMLVLYEAEGMSGDTQNYFIRSLLSEGVLRYETVVKGENGLESKLIEREGPTGLIVTTTATRLHPENETRLISLSVTDTPEQTRGILAALAEERVAERDLTPWLALQTWLEGAKHRVGIPFAPDLACTVPPVAVRLRRDFGAVLNLIRAHAVLHQATRERDEQGRIVATLDDYAKVRELVADLVSEGVGATVPASVRETVEKVKALYEDNEREAVSIKDVAEELRVDHSAASRRVKAARERGFVNNLEDRRGKPARLVPGDDMPEDLTILPAVEDLRAALSGIAKAA